MPRGQRKSLEEKIQAKQELINALNIRIESEERELEELYEKWEETRHYCRASQKTCFFRFCCHGP